MIGWKNLKIEVSITNQKVFLFVCLFVRGTWLRHSAPVVPFGQSIAKSSNFLVLSLFHFFGILRVPESVFKNPVEVI